MVSRPPHHTSTRASENIENGRTEHGTSPQSPSLALRLVLIAASIAFVVALVRWRHTLNETLPQSLTEPILLALLLALALYLLIYRPLFSDFSRNPMPEDVLASGSLAARLVTLSPDIIASTNLEGRIIEVSLASQKILGWSIKELVGKPIVEIVHPEDRAMVLDAFQDAARVAASPNFSCRMLCKDSAYRWLDWAACSDYSEATIYLIGRDATKRRQVEEALGGARGELERRVLELNEALDKARQELTHERQRLGLMTRQSEERNRRDLSSVERIIHMATDISNRSQAEFALRESEARFRNMVEQAAIGIALVNAQGEIEEANQALQKMLGYSRAELIGRQLADCSHSDDFAAQEKLDRELSAGRRDRYVLEKRFIRKDGSLLWGRLTATIVDRDSQSRRIDMVEDITDGKRAVEDLARMQREWEDIFHSINHPTMVLDRQHGIIAVNEATLRGLGRSKEEILGKKCYQVLHGADAPVADCPMERAIEQRCSQSSELMLESLGRRCLVSCNPVFNEAGEIEKVIHISTDVTERVLAEEALRDIEGRLSAVFETVRLQDAGRT